MKRGWSWRNGVLGERVCFLTTQDNVLTMFPALNIDRDVASRGLDILRVSI